MNSIEDENTNTDITLEEENHLRQTLAMIHEAIASAEELVGQTEKSYQDHKTYMVEFRGEIDPSEQFQNELFLKEIDRNSAQAFISKKRLEKLLSSPYFARISFMSKDLSELTIAYIGRFTFSFNNESIISDWRSPIASLFYDFDIGEAVYEAPLGLIEGTLTEKRQIEIDNGKLLYAVETSSSIRDEVLEHELGKNSDEKMRTIVSSIQREQNRIIRDDMRGTLIIQGVAGSGKTSVALHRVAYLLYRYKDSLSFQAVAILSPNKVFGDYISKVLPELGEEPIKELYLRDIYERVLDDALIIQAQRSFVDDTSVEWKERASFKGSSEFARLILAYLEEVTTRIFVAEEISIGRHRIDAAWLEERFYSYGSLPILERINMLASDIVLDLSSQLMTLGIVALPTKGELKTKLTRMLIARDEVALYKLFYKEESLKKYFHMPSKDTVEWEDACALIFFKGAFVGFETFSEIKHLVVDEMQDLTPIQHMMMARLFTGEKTILGDYHQMVDADNTMNLELMESIYTDTHVVELKRSYRSTIEIMELAGRVKDIPGLESVARHGEKPTLLACDNTLGVLEQLMRLIRDFEAGEHRTLGILHKSDVIAERYYELLVESQSLHLITPQSDSFENGVSISSIKMAKGLEFDEVVILDADSEHYSSDYDRNLLYVAITRAMHKLTILYRREPSKFLS